MAPRADLDSATNAADSEPSDPLGSLRPEAVNPPANLHRASARGERTAVLFAIGTGADVEGTDDDGWRPLHLAAAFDHAAVAALLLDAGAQPDGRSRHPGGCDGATPLHVATASGSAEVASILLAVGARTDVRDDAGFTPLHISAARGDLPLVRLLLRSGADPDSRLDDTTPLDLARRAGHRAVAALIRQCARRSTSR